MDQILNKMGIIMPLELWGIFFGIILSMLLWLSIALIREWLYEMKIHRVTPIKIIYKPLNIPNIMDCRISNIFLKQYKNDTN
jgi:hypothetical protein